MAAVNALSRLAVPAFIGISLAQASLYDGASSLLARLSSTAYNPPLWTGSSSASEGGHSSRRLPPPSPAPLIDTATPHQAADQPAY